MGGNVWVGGVREGDTLVSVAIDNQTTAGYTVEIFSKAEGAGAFRPHTVRDSLYLTHECQSVWHSDDARSELDLTSVSIDTITDIQFTGFNSEDGRRHKPLGIAMTQTVSGWSYDYARDFVIVSYTIKNIGFRPGRRPGATQRIEGLYVAMVNDAWIWPFPYPITPDDDREHNDDVSGTFRTTSLPGHPGLTDTVNVAWVADNNGNPVYGRYDRVSKTSVYGARLLSPMLSTLRYSFNWWAGHSYFAKFWAPCQRNTKAGRYVFEPRTDKDKYIMMSNGEWDYDQVECAIDHQAEGWLQPPANARDIADGYWLVRYMLSVGPFDLNLGDSVTVAFAIIGAENFHTDPTNFDRFFNPYNPQPYLDRLDFSRLAKNAQWAAWMYDSPGVDTDGDGYKGEFMLDGQDTVYYRGDGVPDFTGPPPPTPPHLEATTEEAKVILHFNGRRSETELDPFSNRADFEGYRIYMSRTGRSDDWSLLAGRDIVNWARMTWNPTRQRWLQTGPPFTVDSLHQMYDSTSVADFGYPFHPDSFTVADFNKALLEIKWDPEHPVRVDSFYHYFTRYEANQSPDDELLAGAAASGGNVTGVIRKLYPDAKRTDTIWNDDGTFFLPYYDYEYAIDGLQVAEPIFFAITAFDHGDADAGLAPLESAQSVSQIEVWPINSVEVVKSQHPKPGVYPNPYRMIDEYNAAGWENPRGLEPDPERARRVTFYNVPDTCVVSIWSIDGDLIKRLEHKADPANSEASVVRWNLITRNTQAIKTGIYIYSVESRFGTDVGKLVIIK